MPRTRASGIRPPVRFCAALAVWIVAHAIPRDDTRWVFGSLGGEAVHGNAKYLYLHTTEIDAGIRPVWVGKQAAIEPLLEAGYPAVDERSLRGRWAVLRAGVVINAHGIDVPWWLTGGARLVQLWHGNGIKRIGWPSDEFDRMGWARRWFYRAVYWNWDVAIASAPGEPRRRLEAAFGMPTADVPVTGYPRTDVFFGDPPALAHLDAPSLYERIEDRASGRTIITYVPTYRKGYGNVHAGSPPTENLDFDRLDAFLAEADAELLIKLHPRESFDPDDVESEHVTVLPRRLDVMPILAHTDVLLTDYSSVYLDYLLLDRPIVFFAPDRERYLASQQLSFAYEKVTPGPVVETSTELVAVLEDVLGGKDACATERARVRDRFHQYRDGAACVRVHRAIRRRLAPLGPAPAGATGRIALPSKAAK